MTDEAKLVEELARIIDPHANWDHTSKDDAKFAHDREKATDKARAVLASPVFTRLIAERDGVYERAAQVGYRICAETRHITLGDKVAATIRSLTDRSADDAKL